MGGGYTSLRFKLKTPSHVVHTRCLIFCLSEICVTLLGVSVGLHHTRCWEAK